MGDLAPEKQNKSKKCQKRRGRVEKPPNPIPMHHKPRTMEEATPTVATKKAMDATHSPIFEGGVWGGSVWGTSVLAP